jgi:DNA mismatch endonuclease (patch repair protein)
MQTTRRRDTAPELALRREIRSRGLGYRVDAKLPGLRRRADLVFLRATVAVFVDGCFWHRCPEHATRPAANAQWWDDKLTTNQRRDADTDRTLREAGWLVIRIWEHQTQQPADLSAAADAVEAAVLGRRRRTVPVDRAAASS